jgi:hypothetical protein
MISASCNMLVHSTWIIHASGWFEFIHHMNSFHSCSFNNHWAKQVFDVGVSSILKFVSLNNIDFFKAKSLHMRRVNQWLAFERCQPLDLDNLLSTFKGDKDRAVLPLKTTLRNKKSHVEENNATTSHLSSIPCIETCLYPFNSQSLWTSCRYQLDARLICIDDQGRGNVMKFDQVYHSFGHSNSTCKFSLATLSHPKPYNSISNDLW